MNKLNIFSAMLIAIVLGFSGNLSANTNNPSEEEIKAACIAESKEASYPQEYIEECIEEKKQALKEQGEESKEAS